MCIVLVSVSSKAYWYGIQYQILINNFLVNFETMINFPKFEFDIHKKQIEWQEYIKGIHLKIISTPGKSKGLLYKHHHHLQASIGPHTTIYFSFESWSCSLDTVKVTYIYFFTMFVCVPRCTLLNSIKFMKKQKSRYSLALYDFFYLFFLFRSGVTTH